MHHLNVRVAWHDSRWDGTICRNPIGNAFCVDLDRIRAERIDVTEQELAGKRLGDLTPQQHPPCIAESGAFMNKSAWTREFSHPYQALPKTKDSHGQLKRTSITVEPYTTFVVPFLWMLKEQQDRIDAGLPIPLPPDEESPFNSSWVFGRHRQEALCDLFFGRLTPSESLVFFYTKAGQPVDESISRLVIGVGTIASISGLLRYDSATKVTYPMWDQKVQHSIRPDGSDGFLLPYHDYLGATGDAEEDARRLVLLKEIAVVPEQSQMASFSFAGELSTSDVALSTLVKCLNAVRKIREHGIAKGPWERREEWLNTQIAQIWRDRGAFPGTGAVLEALGLRLGTSLMLELIAKKTIAPKDDPWGVLDRLLRGHEPPPSPAYVQDIKGVASIWSSLSDTRRSLLKLLSRFDLSSSQALRWFDPQKRAKATRASIDDAAILENPYRIVELDLGDYDDHPVSLGTVDRGLMPDSTVAVQHPVPEPSAISSLLDRRRVRAVYVSVLRAATLNGDSLLSEAETGELIAKLDLSHPCLVPHDWLSAEAAFLEQETVRVQVMKEPSIGDSIPCLQLIDVNARESKLSRILGKRSETNLPSLKENWQSLLVNAIVEGGGHVNLEDQRHRQALEEQADALERITSRKLSVLVGRAGTGKTTVLGALMKASSLRKDGLLFLAPTGKARVRLAQKAGADAMTVAQFLYSLGRYDGTRQRPLFEGREQYRKEKTVIIDESSMLTLDDLFATLQALDLAHVQRVILVGDPNQLPPIGIGRPFADLVSHLEDSTTQRSGTMAKLTIELRTQAGAPSDLLKLASWYTREIQPVDADRVLSDLDLGNSFNDLTIRHWTDTPGLHQAIGEELVKRLQLNSIDDIEGFNQQALGLTKEGWTPFEDHDGPDNFQVLSPVRLHPYGVHDLNRWFQKAFRAQQIASPRGIKLGEEEIVWGDKVILIRNGQRDGFDFSQKAKVKEYLANGEIGIANSAKAICLNVAFTSRPGVRFGFFPGQFSPEGSPLELAYAITVHKAQGSEFRVVFLVLPRNTRLLSRELLYTALTRARHHLVLLVEGSDSSGLYDLTRPEKSETARRNTNLFAGSVREQASDVPYATHLVHRARNGGMVRSKSELVIANHLIGASIPFIYERPLEGTFTVGRLRPDFSFITDAGEVIVWEHLGMLNRDDYRRGWDWKKAWYEANGYCVGENLFITVDDERGGLDPIEIERTASKIADILS